MAYNAGVFYQRATTASSGDDPAEPDPRYRIVNALYRGWLGSSGILDPHARLEQSTSLGYVGRRGPDRAVEDTRLLRSAHPNLKRGGAYDVLPEQILIGANQVSSGFDLDEAYADWFEQHTGIELPSLEARKVMKFLLNGKAD